MTTPAPTVFRVEYRYDPALAAKRDELRPAHRAFLGELFDAGTILIAGPFTDGTGGLFLVRGESAEAVGTLLDADPFAQAGLVAERRINPWTQIFGTLPI